MLKIGQGLDVHAFTNGDFVTLGGIKIPHTHGIKAHSDGDVLLHALSDALLGALALGDIGQHFPDTDPAFKGADSKVLLKKVYDLVKDRGYELINADMTVICEAPKLAPHNRAMRECIAGVLGVSVDVISIKATTNEKMGYLGRGEGIFASGVVLLQKLPWDICLLGDCGNWSNFFGSNRRPRNGSVVAHVSIDDYLTTSQALHLKKDTKPMRRIFADDWHIIAIGDKKYQVYHMGDIVKPNFTTTRCQKREAGRPIELLPIKESYGRKFDFHNMHSI